MKIYIDGEKLMESFYDTPESEKSWSRAWRLINHAKLADVRENVRGEWIKKKGSLWTLATCSVCGELSVEGDKPFCPNCGADMRGEKGNDERI